MRRPHIPIDAKLAVAGRQLLQLQPEGFFGEFSRREGESLGELLERRLVRLAELLGCERRELRLDHDPQVALRHGYDPKRGRWPRDFADPAKMIYRSHHGHHIKSNVAGEHGARSDTSERVHQRRLAKNREKRKNRRRSPKASPKYAQKYAWPKGRKVHNRSSWPKGRKLRRAP